MFEGLGFVQLLPGERGKTDLAKRKRGVSLGSGHSWQGTECVGRGHTEVLGRAGCVPLGWREMKCEPLNAAAAAS